MKKETIFLGADHRGVALKAKVIAWLRSHGYESVDCGAYEPDPPCDYPKLSLEVARNVAAHRKSLGILVCMTGIGHSVAANKVPGVNAALCYNKEAAVLSRQHNDANVLVLGSKFVGEKAVFGIIEAWLSARFEGGRHARRVRQIRQIERTYSRCS